MFFKYIFLSSLILFGLSSCSQSSDESSANTRKVKVWEKEPYYKYAWHINSENSALHGLSYNIDKSADINLNNIWDITQGENVKVAVIDDSFDVEHEDLKANVFVKYNIDDDNTDVSNDTPSSLSHGNSCAGFILSPINAKGTIGIAPKASLIAIKQNLSTDVDTIKAFEYAKNQGAKVINCSWGTENVSQAVADEIKSLYDANITIVFASGNDAKNLDDVGINDESELPWVIGVGSSTEVNDVASYSNYGQNIDLIAPGGVINYIGILGLDDSGNNGSSNQQSLVTNNYAFIEGTSFSAPLVVGTIALMYSVYPNITPDQVRTILTQTATKIGNTASYDGNGFDTKRAYGKLNVYEAIMRVIKKYTLSEREL